MNIFLQHLITQGVPKEFLVFVLLLPVVATLITLARQIIGLKGLGLYIPLMITFVLLSAGLGFGLLLSLVSLVAGSLMHLLLRRWRLLYLPRISLILTGTAIIVLLFVWLINLTFSVNIISGSVLAALLIIALSERFAAVQIEHGSKIALVLIIETFVLATIAYLLADWQWLQNFTLAYPWIVILGVIIMNIFLGRWTGLRLFEYQRFREVFRHGEFPSKK